MGKRLSISPHAAHCSGPGKRTGPIAPLPPPLILALLLSLLGCVLPRLAAGSPGRPRSLLDEAPGLEKPVTYSETKIPLGEFLTRVAADTGVTLTAASDVADEPVAVIVTDVPARELLDQLADLLDYRWRRTAGVRGRGLGVGKDAARQSPTPNPQPAGTPPFDAKAASNGGTPFATPTPAFEIYQDVASKNREEALRQAVDAGLEKRFQEEMAIGRELAGRTQEEMERLWEQRTRWQERLDQLPPREQQALEHSPEGQAARKYQWLRAMWSPIQRVLAGWTLRLPPPQWAAIRTGQELIFTSDPKSGELPLPAAVLRGLRAARPVLPPASQPDQEAALRQEQQKRQMRWAQAEQYLVSVRWGGQGVPVPGLMDLFVYATPYGANIGDIPWQEETIFSFGVWASPEDAGPAPEEDPQRRALLEKDQLLSLKKPYHPDTRPYVDPLFPGASRPFRFLPEYLPGLSAAYGVNFIADSYWRAEIPSGVGTLGGTAPLFEVLDRLAGTAHTWDRREKLIRIRDRKWYLDRPAEIPLRLVRRWVSVSDQRGALPLAEFSVAATALTDAQLGELIGGWFFPPQLNDLRESSGGLEKSRYLLRLYGTLSAGQQRSLWEGKSLTIAPLLPAQRSLVEAELKRIAHTRDLAMDLGQWQAGNISFAGQPDVRIRERRGQSLAFRLESESTARVPATPDEIQRFPVTHLEMRIRSCPQDTYVLRLTVASEPGAAVKP